jgi:hypothetical protein
MRIKSVLLSLSAIAALSANLADATPLITNGNFELTTNGGNQRLAASTAAAARAGNQTTLVGWTSSNGNDGGWNFLLNANTATTTSSALMLKGNNGFTGSAGGGNFFASDALYHPGTLFQTISGLTIGNDYTLTFDYALSQQAGFTGANANNYWQVGLGSTYQTSTFQNSGLLSIPNGGFSGWQSASMTFTATSTSEILSFLAKTSSSGAPPFLLLDDVKMEAKVPEPSTLSLLLGGVGLAAFAARRRRAKRA